MTVEIRLIQEGDIEGLRAALNAVGSERKYILTLEAPPLERVQEFVLGNIQHNHAQYVAVDNGVVVGWADIVPRQKESVSHAGMLGMGLLKDYRGQGIGSRLLEEVINHAFGKGLTRLELEVFADNAVAIALYEKFGFEHEGRKRNARKIDDEYQDILVMARLA